MSKEHEYAVYILTNERQTVYYVGVTSELMGRVWQHKQHIAKGFTDQYNVVKLVYYECFEDVALAIQREKQLKKFSRRKKCILIDKFNPEWKDLYQE